MKQLRFILILTILILGSHAYHLPIIQKYRKLPHIIKQIENKPLQKAMASIVVAHGTTDIFTKPIDKVYANYFNSFVLMYVSKKELRYLILFIASIFHFSRDMLGSHKIAQSIVLHLFFIFKPNWCFRYLTFLHTPLHYYSFLKIGNNIIYMPLFILLSWGCYYIPYKEYNSLWLAPVLGHILNY